MRIYLSLPSYDQRYWSGTLMSVYHCSEGLRGDVHVYPDPINGSVQPRVFNQALGRAVMNRFDILAMLHADIGVEVGWLGKMVSTMNETGADVLSAVVPLKDDSRLSSTGIACGDGERRSLSMDAVAELPKVFDVHTGGLPWLGAKTLLLNTGVMLMRLDRPWLRMWSGFAFRTSIDWLDDGGARVNAVSEDWDMCEQLAAIPEPPRLMATRAVRCQHYGGKAWEG